MNSDQPSSSALSFPTSNTANITNTANIANAFTAATATLKPVSVDTVRTNTAPPPQPVIPDQVTPSVDHGTRKRKLSIGDTDEKKSGVKTAEIKLSPEKKKPAVSDESKTAIISSMPSKPIGTI